MDPQGKSSDDSGDRRAADDRLIHALLLHVCDERSTDRREQRVQRAMAGIRETAPASTTPGKDVGPAARRLRLLSWQGRMAWVAAALILVAVGLGVLALYPTSAMASLDEILRSLGRPGDRTYRIQMVDLPAPLEGRPAEEDWPARIPKPGLNGATLYLRDGLQYLLARKDPRGEWIYDGFDGRMSWRVKDGRVAEMRVGLGAGGIPMPPIMADVPFCDLHQTLDRIRVDYTVEHVGKASLGADSTVLKYVRVRRNARDVKGPDVIEIWADLDSAMPKRIVFDDAKIPGNPQPCRITFDLLTEDPLLPDWFTPAPHRAEDE